MSWAASRVVALWSQGFLAIALEQAVACLPVHVGFEGHEGFDAMGSEDWPGALVEALRERDDALAASTAQVVGDVVEFEASPAAGLANEVAAGL